MAVEVAANKEDHFVSVEALELGDLVEAHASRRYWKYPRYFAHVGFRRVRDLAAFVAGEGEASAIVGKDARVRAGESIDLSVESAVGDTVG